jgi:transcriptional regulator with XRE-family HTH domain
MYAVMWLFVQNQKLYSMDSNIKKFMKSNKITKKVLGDVMDLSQPTVKKYCANPSYFNLEHYRKLSEHLALDVSYIIQTINGTEEKV